MRQLAKGQWTKWIGCGLVSLALISTMTACSFGTNGTDGLSAYEIAVQNGFVGTEQEWLESLKSDSSFTLDDVYDSAVENGYTGTYLEFIQDYFSLNASEEVNHALLSVVSVVAQFKEVTSGGWFGQSSTQTVYSAGSGVIYQLDRESGDAYIITNYHVVYDVKSTTGISDAIGCYLYGMEYSNSSFDYTIPCEYVGGSMTYDLAVLRVQNSDVLKSSNAEAVTFADSNTLAVGEQAFAIGNPEGAGISVTSGVVSVDSEYITMTAADEKSTVNFRVIRTDTPINSGNSGGGLFNREGELIGIVNAKSVEENVENIGYAIPSTLAKYVVENILDHSDTKQVQKALIGITVSASSSKAIYDKEEGLTRIVEEVMVQSVTPGSVGDGVMQMGDIIRSITVDGETTAISRMYQVTDLMLTVRAGDTVVLLVDRNGDTQEISFTFTENDISTIV